MNNHLDEFRDPLLASEMAGKLKAFRCKPCNIMEVCGTHTVSISRYGIRRMLPEGVRLVSGPGCPVCVTPVGYIDAAVQLAQIPDVILTTFGDLMRVPGSSSSLLKEKALGRDIRVVLSPLDSVKVAAENPGKKVAFLSVGFETTIPVSALSVLNAVSSGIRNYYLLSANKTMPAVLEALASDPEANVDGYLYPGHVSAVTGTGFYEKLADKLGTPGVVAGFEPLDILYAVIKLLEFISEGKAEVFNQYSRIVREEGNPAALEVMNSVFEPCRSYWRGIGEIEGSGLRLRDKYKRFDAWQEFGISHGSLSEPAGCMCGSILKGTKRPLDCALFDKVCTPENPVGACMVSSEGTCAAYHKYGGI